MSMSTVCSSSFLTYTFSLHSRSNDQSDASWCGVRLCVRCCLLTRRAVVYRVTCASEFNAPWRPESKTWDRIYLQYSCTVLSLYADDCTVRCTENCALHVLMKPIDY